MASIGHASAHFLQSRHLVSSMLNFPSALITTAWKGHSTSQVAQQMHFF
jgi:hypothetical protein